MPVRYRFNGDHIAQLRGRWDVQHQNNGMLELNIDRLVPGGKQTLILSIADFTIPPREVARGDLPYINGSSSYPTKAAPRGNITVTFRDYIQGGTRGALQRWFSAVYDEATGIMLPPSIVKTTGYVVLFSSHGVQERAARLEGLWPTKEPPVDMKFEAGEVMLMPIEIAVDRVIWESSLTAPFTEVA